MATTGKMGARLGKGKRKKHLVGQPGVPNLLAGVQSLESGMDDLRARVRF